MDEIETAAPAPADEVSQVDPAPETPPEAEPGALEDGFVEVSEPEAVTAPARAMVNSSRPKGQRWFDLKASNDEGGELEVAIYDEIGFWGLRAADLIGEIKRHNPTKCTLRINSPGGDVFDGIAIANFVANMECETVAIVDGYAASIASVIAMGADRVVMPENALMMIHDPWGFAMGGADDMRALADSLDRVKSAIVATYRRKTKMDAGRLGELMAAETWMTAAEAAEMGFADEVAPALKMVAHCDLSRFRNAPRIEVPEPAPVRDLAAEAVEIARMCDAAGMPAGPFIEQQQTPEQVKARIALVGDIRALCARARLGGSATDQIVAKSSSIGDARTAILDTMISAQSPEINPTRPAASVDPPPVVHQDLDPAGIVARMKGRSHRHGGR